MEKYNEKRINIFCILADIIKGLKYVLAVGLALALLSYVFVNVTYTPVYTSSTTFVVSSKANFSGPLEDSDKLESMTDTFKAVMNSSVLKKMVCEDLDLDSFPGTIGVAIVEGTNLLTVSVSAGDPDMAYRLLDSLLDCYPVIGEKVLGDIVINVYEEPAFPETPDNAVNGLAIMKRGFAMGAAAVILVLAVISYLKNTVKDKEDIPEKLDTTELITLYHENKYKDFKSFLKRKKKQILLTNAAVSFGYGENIKKLRTKLIYRMKKKGVKVILVTSTLDGEGKTTIALNLAETMSKKYQKVLLVEGDSRQCQLADMLGIGHDEGLDWGSGLKKEQNLQQYIVPAGKHKFYAMVNMAAGTFSTDSLSTDKMQECIHDLRETMDVIIIDGPPATERSDAEVWARLSDVSLLVVKQNFAEVKYINDTIDMLNGYGEGLLGCIFNDVLSSGEVLSSGYGYGSYGAYGGYGSYGGYGKYGRYGAYGAYGAYGKNREKGVGDESEY